MSDVLAKEVIPTPDAAYYTGDRSIALEFYPGAPTPTSSTVVAYQRRPIDRDPLSAQLELNKYEAHATERFVPNIGHAGDLPAFGGIQYHKELAESLGYSWRSEEDNDGKTHERWIEFTYPSPDYLNSILDEISPGEGLRFATFKGGEYSPIDFAQALVDRKALVATEHPYQLHDHVAFHVLGSIGLSGDLLEEQRNLFGPYLERYNAELDLPSVPHGESQKIHDFLHPSYVVLKSMLELVDGFTTTVGNANFVYSEDDADRKFRRTESATESLYRIDNVLGVIPSLMIDTPKSTELKRYAAEINDRYNTLGARAIQLVA